MHTYTDAHILRTGAVSHLNITWSSEKREITVDLCSWGDFLEKVAMGLDMGEWLR